MQSKNNKICITSISLGKGGAERSCAMLSQLLDGLGYEVHIVILNNDIDFPYSGKLFNLGLLKTEQDTLSNRYNRFRKFRDYLRDNEISVVIDHRPKNQYFRELFYHHFVYKGIQKIYVTHSSNAPTYLTQKPKQFVKLCNQNLTNVAVSKYIETQVLKAAGVEKTCTIYNGYKEEWGEIQTQLPEEISGSKYILSYGRIDDAIKDFTFLMNSYSQSCLWEQGIQLVIMGEGKDKQMLQELAATIPGGEQIVFLPFTAQPFAYIQQAHCVALTSRYEGFPMVLVEALSLGTPVVSLDIVSGPSEIIVHEKNGLLIEKREVPLFAQSLVRMCTDENLYQHCKENTKTSVTRFSSSAIAQDWHNLLQHESY